MKEITLYFAGAWSGGDATSDKEVTLGVRNKLCSFLYPNQLESWLRFSEHVEGKILIDSGAFSAWNKGMAVDFDKYIQYCQDALDSPLSKKKKIRVVNLDVIPGKAGETANLNTSVKKQDRQVIEDAANQGYKNLCYFLGHGITPIHVFHQGEDFKWLDKMVEKTDYIGISPANDVGSDQKRLWIDRTFSYLEKNNIKVDTHGFAVWSPSIISDFPWTSCDAATWRLLAAYGGIFYPVGGFKNPDFSINPITMHVSDRKFNTDLHCFGKEIKEMLKDDGYELSDLQEHWSGRAEINIRYFVEFEKWVNNVKKVKEFKVKKSFFGGTA